MAVHSIAFDGMLFGALFSLLAFASEAARASEPPIRSRFACSSDRGCVIPLFLASRLHKPCADDTATMYKANTSSPGLGNAGL